MWIEILGLFILTTGNETAVPQATHFGAGTAFVPHFISAPRSENFGTENRNGFAVAVFVPKIVIRVCAVPKILIRICADVNRSKNEDRLCACFAARKCGSTEQQLSSGHFHKQGSAGTL